MNRNVKVNISDNWKSCFRIWKRGEHPSWISGLCVAKIFSHKSI